MFPATFRAVFAADLPFFADPATFRAVFVADLSFFADSATFRAVFVAGSAITASLSVYALTLQEPHWHARNDDSRKMLHEQAETDAQPPAPHASTCL